MYYIKLPNVCALFLKQFIFMYISLYIVQRKNVAKFSHQRTAIQAFVLSFGILVAQAILNQVDILPIEDPDKVERFNATKNVGEIATNTAGNVGVAGVKIVKTVPNALTEIGKGTANVASRIGNAIVNSGNAIVNSGNAMINSNKANANKANANTNINGVNDSEDGYSVNQLNDFNNRFDEYANGQKLPPPSPGFEEQNQMEENKMNRVIPYINRYTHYNTTPGYTYVDPKAWRVPTPQPPICLTDRPCTVQPVMVGTSAGNEFLPYSYVKSNTELQNIEKATV